MKTAFLTPRFYLAVLCGAVIFLGGCSRKTDNTMNFMHAINDYYSAHPECLWREPVKFPVQADTSDASKTAAYDALADQGLLVRTTAENKKMVILDKQVNNYDLSDKGRSVWTGDPDQPGYGNFCYGHKKVQGIDSATPTNSEEGATTKVNYRTTVSDVPAWATAAETQNAYPEIRTALSGSQRGEALLINTHDGWKVGRINPAQS